MKRLLKKLFSRFFIIALTIVLLFALVALFFIGVLYTAEEVLCANFPDAADWIRILFGAADWFMLALTIVHIVNRDMIPEAKLPWIICVVMFNLFGVAIYIVFSNTRPSRKQRRQYAMLNEHSRPYIQRAVSRTKRSDAMGNWAAVSEGLHKINKNAVIHANTRTEYFASGEAFFVRFLEDLRSAKKFIFLEYFILARGKMWGETLEVLKEKVKEGVEVRVTYDDIGCMGKLRAGYYRTLRKAGINCVKFNPFVPIVSNIHNFRDHRKIAIIDGTVGYTGGINLADEYINAEQPFGYWKDTAVRLEGEGVIGLTLMFLRLYNIRAKELEDFSPYIPETFEKFEGEGFVQPYGDGPRPLYEAQVGEEVYINVLAAAQKYVYITTPYLIIDYRMRGALLSAAARGVDVRIITPRIPDKKVAFSITRSNYTKLIRGGVKIYEYTPGFIHAKSFLADDDVGIVGTINLDYRSLMHHFENAVLMYRTKANAQLKEDFEEMFKASALQTEEDAKKPVVWRWLCEIAKMFAPMF